MEIVEITTENAEEFSGFIDEDTAESLERVFYRGIGALDDDGSVRGALVYELINSESDEDTKSRILIFGGDDDTAKEALIKEYTTAIADDDVAESFYETADREMAEALQTFGFSREKSESLDIFLTIDELKGIGPELKVTDFPSDIVDLSDVSVLQYRGFAKMCLFHDHRGLVDDLAYLPTSWFDRELSSCCVVDDKVDGGLLVKKAPSGILYIMLFAAFGVEYQNKLRLMMAYTTEKIIENEPADVRVVIRRHNEPVKKLTDRFFAACKGEPVSEGNRGER